MVHEHAFVIGDVNQKNILSVPAPEAAAEATNRAVLELVATLDGNDMRNVNRSLGDSKTIGADAAPAVPRLTKFLLQNDPTYRGDKMREIQSHAQEVLRVLDPNRLSSNQCEQLVIELTKQLERSRPRFGRTPHVTEPSEARVAAALGVIG